MAEILYLSSFPFCVPEITTQDKEAMIELTLAEAMDLYWKTKELTFNSLTWSISALTFTFGSTPADTPLTISKKTEIESEVDLICTTNTFLSDQIYAAGSYHDPVGQLSFDLSSNLFKDSSSELYYLNPGFAVNQEVVFDHISSIYTSSTTESNSGAWVSTGDSIITFRYNLGSIGTFSLVFSGTTKTCPIYGAAFIAYTETAPTSSVSGSASATVTQSEKWDFAP